MIGEIAVVDEVSVVSIGRVVLAAASDGLVLTAGFAPENGAETAVSEKKKKINDVVLLMMTAFLKRIRMRTKFSLTHPLIPLRRRR